MRRTALIVPTVAVAGLFLLAGCSGGGDSCLSGSWEPVDGSPMSPTADQIEAMKSMGGSYDFTLKFDGNTISIDASSMVPATDVTKEQTTSRTVKAKYSVSGDTIKLSNMSGSYKINGEEQTGDSGMGFDNLEGDTSESTYSCSDDKLTIDRLGDFQKKKK